MDWHLWSGWFFRGLGVCMLLMVPYESWRAYRARGWSSTDGVVTGCEIQPDEDDSYRIKLAYRFEVEGRKYLGERRVPVDGPMRKGKVQRLARSFPIGGLVRVYYPVDDPSQAMLQPGLQPWRLVMLTVCGFALSADVWTSFFD